MPSRLTVIGEREKPDHHHLPADSMCYFWGEYTPHEHTDGKRWDYSSTNKLMSNLKKKMDRAGQWDWHYKQEAIQDAANAFARSWKWTDLHETHRVALIPIPPSKARAHALYDPRMLQVVQNIAQRAGLPLDIRDCLSFSGRYAASHETADRPTPDELYEDLTFDATVGRPGQPPGVIFLFDDMLTAGSHFVAVKRRLADVFGDVPVVGNFVARRILPNPFADFDDLDAI